MRRKLVSLFLILIDGLIVTVTPYIALFLRFDGMISEYYFNVLNHYLPVIMIVHILIFHLFGLYRRLWRYASIHELLVTIAAVTMGAAASFGYVLLTNLFMPRSIYIICWFLNIALIGGSRIALRVYYHIRNHYHQSPTTNVLIVGAGDAGAMIAKELNKLADPKNLVGFVDDDEYKQEQMLSGKPVLGRRKDIQDIVDKYDVHEIIIAMPSVGGSVIRAITNECKETGCKVQILPGIYELIDGKVTLNQLRNINLEDLLRREPVQLHMEEIAGYLKGKCVLVTGAGGSIGSELCRQIMRFSPAKLVLLGKGENSIYEIHQELKGKHPEGVLHPVIADVKDSERINHIFAKFKPDVVFHAAAHKHVPLMEAQPIEAVKNNIFGTKTVAEAADRAGVKTFIMISTDKAVNPTSVMGATKRVAELIIQNLSKVSKTKFAAVRFGNVLGSRGSVIPLFKKQIASGGPITITHPDMKRYFMTIPEATQLVLQAGALAKGGEVFVLDMGEPVKIVDMARDLIELSGLKPGEDIVIEFCGLRPGEKLFEELLTAEEGTKATMHEKIFVANLKIVDEEKLLRGLLSLQSLKDSNEIITTLTTLLPSYQRSRAKYCGEGTKAVKLDVKKQAGKDIGQYKVAADLQ